MKINSSPDKADSPVSSQAPSRTESSIDPQKTSASAVNRHAAAGDRTAPALSRKELFSRSVETLLKMLKPQNRGQASLKALIQLVQRLPVSEGGLPEKGSDSALLVQVLKQLRLSSEDSLPRKMLQEIQVLEKVLETDPSEKGMLFFPREDQRGRPPLRVEEEGSHPEDEEGEARLTLDFDLDLLGEITVVLRGKENKQSCRIYTAEKGSQDLIRAHKGKLIEQLEKRGLELNDFSVSQKSMTETPSQENRQNREGLELWG
ncbi:MAG: flagellar hook-length control protein FliK [Spirochaetales bacterium]|nr:flagellar hook-length control protein FliK [Spirochaetales bacterium]